VDGNFTLNSDTLQLEGVKGHPDNNLHQHVLLFCTCPVNDIVGNSIMLPRLLSDILRPPSERLISYYECVLQAFHSHMLSHHLSHHLMIMAFDRYVAICNPLRYAAIMTSNMVVKPDRVCLGRGLCSGGDSAGFDHKD
ncbi:unnamed protein product, partial [Pleuronectes platessa]